MPGVGRISAENMGLDILGLWDFNRPEVSETRFRKALADATKDEQIILQTQIARTYGLRKDFAAAQEILATLEPRLSESCAEANVRYWIELGRTYCSPAHPKEARTDEAKEMGRVAYMNAFECAKAAKLDYLAVDALHMMTMVDPAPEAQIEWNHKALEYMEHSDQEDAKKWEGSLRYNLGYALHLAGRYEDALAESERSIDAYERAGRPKDVRYTKWMIAWTYRAMERYTEALEIQLALEKEWTAEGVKPKYVIEELAHIYRAMGDEAKAADYEQLNSQPT